MRTLKIILAYDGTRFVGWQRQAEGESIQGLLEDALARFEGAPVTVHGAVKGSWLAAKRLAKCHPWNAGGVDHVPAGHRHWPEGRTPTIVVLNNPDQFLAAQADEEGRPAA